MEPDRTWPNPVDAQAGTGSWQGLRPWQAAPRAAVAVLMVYVIFEYLRPHQIWPIIGQLRIQTATTAALVLIVIAQTAKQGVRLSRQSWLLLGFLGLAIFTILPATHQYYAYDFAYDLTLILVGYFAITHTLQNERDLKRFLSLLVSIHIYLAVKGILEYSQSTFDYSAHSFGYASTGKVGGSFLGDENDVALAMIVILPFAVFLFRQTRSLVARLMWGAGSVAIILTIILALHEEGSSA